jgi:hypothetical protein
MAQPIRNVRTIHPSQLLKDVLGVKRGQRKGSLDATNTGTPQDVQSVYDWAKDLGDGNDQGYQVDSSHGQPGADGSNQKWLNFPSKDEDLLRGVNPGRYVMPALRRGDALGRQPNDREENAEHVIPADAGISHVEVRPAQVSHKQSAHDFDGSLFLLVAAGAFCVFALAQRRSPRHTRPRAC